MSNQISALPSALSLSHPTFLKRFMIFDALAQATAAAISLFGASALVEWTRILDANWYTLFGVIMFISAGLTYLGTRIQPLPKAGIYLLIGVNYAVGILCLGVLILGWANFTDGALWVLGIMSASGFFLADVELLAVRRLR